MLCYRTIVVNNDVCYRTCLYLTALLHNIFMYNSCCIEQLCYIASVFEERVFMGKCVVERCFVVL